MVSFTDLALSATDVAVYESGLSPQYDITWSFTYELANYTPGDEIGFCMFLQDESVEFNAGGPGFDLGFTGGTIYSDFTPMSGGIVGIGLDTMGAFAASAQYVDGFVRSGSGEDLTGTDTLAIRGPNNQFITSAAINAFDILSEGKKTLRARLGNYGRKIQVDYKSEGDTFFTNLINTDVLIQGFTTDSKWRPGVTVCKPLTGAVTNADIIISNFHVEGKTVSVDESDFEFTPIIPFVFEPGSLGEVPQPIPSGEAKPRLPFLNMEPAIGCPDNKCGLSATNGTDSEGFFPQSILYSISSFIGDVEVQWNTSSNPYRFVFEYEDTNTIDTGYVGNASYDFGGTSRSTFTTGMLSSYAHGSNTSNDLAPDGFPYVRSSLSNSVSSFYKDTDSSRVTLNIFAPLSTTDWEAIIGCPYYTLSCGVEDSYLCGLTQSHETLRKIVFTNL